MASDKRATIFNVSLVDLKNDVLEFARRIGVIDPNPHRLSHFEFSLDDENGAPLNTPINVSDQGKQPSDPIMGIDLGSGDRTVVIEMLPYHEPNDLRVIQEMQTRFEREIERVFAIPVYLNAVTNNREHEQNAQVTLEQLARYVDMRHVRPSGERLYPEEGYLSQRRWSSKDFDINDEAERRAMVLLKSNLTLEQRVTYDAYGYFDVVGGYTGRTYRLVNRKVMNIHKVNDRGHVIKTWCVVPKGDLPLGDVLLAQKLALELFELDTLAQARVVYDAEREPKEEQA